MRSQHVDDSLKVVLDALTARVGKVMGKARVGAQVLADVAAIDAATLMTIHRSKGLEFYIVIMLGLDDQQWWSYLNDAT